MSLYQKNLGKIGEEKAISFLKNQGFFIIKKNFQTKLGEIDIIAKRGNELHFIEVKTRSNTKKGQPYEAVNQRKIDHLKKAAQFFLLKSKFNDYKLKIDIISIILSGDNEDLKFYENIDI